MKHKMRGNLMLMTTALIWGTAFVAQKSGMDLVSPVAFNGIRTLVGAFALIPVILIMGRNKKKERPDKTLIIGGICCGLALCAAGNIQQIGLYYTSVSHTGFITALYVVIVPLMGLFIKKKITPIMWCYNRFADYVLPHIPVLRRASGLVYFSFTKFVVVLLLSMTICLLAYRRPQSFICKVLK